MNQQFLMKFGLLFVCLMVIVIPVSADTIDFNMWDSGETKIYENTTRYNIMKFVPLNTDGVTEYTWDFGDGTSSTATSPSKVFLSSGTRNVSLSVVRDGDPEIVYKEIEVVDVNPVNFVYLDGSMYNNDLWGGGCSGGTMSLASGSTGRSHTPLRHLSTLVNRYDNLSIEFDRHVSSTSLNGYFYLNDVVIYSSTSTSWVSVKVDFDGDGRYRVNGGAWNNIPVGVGDTVKLSFQGIKGNVGNVLTFNIRDFKITTYEKASGVAEYEALTDTEYQFTELSPYSDYSVGWSWDFGDSSTSTVQHPVHEYAEEGLYEVSFESESSVFGLDGAKQIIELEVIITAIEPVADFIADETSGDVPFNVNFTDLSTGDPTGWIWSYDSGDGWNTFSTDQNSTYEFTIPGSYSIQLNVSNEQGYNISTKVDYVTANAVSPSANFSVNTTSGDAPLSVSFTDESVPGTGAIDSWKWEYNNGSGWQQFSTSQNPSYEFTVAGDYSIRLTVEDEYLESDVETKDNYVIVGDGALAAFSGTPLSGEVPLSVLFTDESTRDPTAWKWEYNNGGGWQQFSTSQNPPYDFTSIGTYSIRLNASNEYGYSIETKDDYITVDPVSPSAAFSGNPLSGDAPLLVSFTDASVPGTGSIESWKWEYNDGDGWQQFSTSQNPSYEFTVPGAYSIRLTVEDEYLESDIETKDNYVTVGAVSPVAAFSGTPLSGAVPHTVTFTDESVPGTGVIVSWKWEYNNGGGWQQFSTSQNPSYEFTVAGDYSIRLTVEDEYLESDVETKMDYISLGESPSAEFTADTTSGLKPLTVQFTDTSSGIPTSWSWNFGDGSAPSTLQNPSHTYTDAGVYTVTLTATNEYGFDAETKIDYIAVHTKPSASFTVDKQGGPEPLVVQFTDTSTPGTGTIVSWSWNFGDGGAPSSSQHPSHTYTSIGVYTVSLTVTDSNGYSDIETKTNHITVFEALVPFPGMTNPPTDLNGDGIYEDINGNGRWDYQDIVLLFQHMAWANANQPIAAFDINKNGRIDFGDITGLWDKMGGL